ncbi:hypothetical protein MNBD_GAMMA12-2708 [hydrothermal vent metagenome]|uniref:Uncharacterized protein n=1 Tax=hydrothermal vent metagenome TaxID=652676 RepID=A0A3B0Z0R0_9ZZZZ
MSAIRVTFILASVFLWIGFYLSGFTNIHWIAYLPAIMMPVAGIIGFCPSTWMLGKVGFKPSSLKS